MSISGWLAAGAMVCILAFCIWWIVDLSYFRWWRRLRGGHGERWRAIWGSVYWLRMPNGRCSAGSPADYFQSGSRVRCEDYVGDDIIARMVNR